MNGLYNVISYIWGIPLTLFIVIAGLYFSKCTNFLQIRGIKTIYKNTIGKLKNFGDESYKTITSVLGGTIGTGNVAGVATAIAVGGPGALFWMWVIALFSMATKMVEVTMAVHYHKKSDDGYVGGPMYYIKHIGRKVGPILSGVYVFFLLVYVLCDSGFVQMNTAATSILDTFNIGKIVVAIFLIGIGILVVSGGLKRVSSILKRSVPIMFIFYFIISLIVIIINIKNLPVGIANVFKYAFSPAPAIGGFAGASVIDAISKGAARGIFANEAGTGTSTTVHATSTNNPVVQGMWGMVEVYIVSFIVCTLTGLLIMSTGVWTSGVDGAPLVLAAFHSVFGNIGKYILCFVIVTFACSTYIGFFYEFSTCMRYIFGDKSFKFLKWIYIFPIVFAVFLPIEAIWSMADMTVGFIVIPNIIALFILSKKFKELFRKYEKIQG